jgi:hypothetical protein
MRAVTRDGAVDEVAGHGVVHVFGNVTRSGEDGWYEVRADRQSWRVRRAAGCLLAPAPGDTVLISGHVGGRIYLLAVVETARDEPLRIIAEGDLLIASRTGSVRVQAPDSVQVVAKRELALQGDAFSLQAAQADCRVTELQYTGKSVHAVLNACRLVGHLCEVVADRLAHMARSAFRLVEETEQVRAGTLDYQAENTARTHARHTVVTATDLVKVDAGQIHVG